MKVECVHCLHYEECDRPQGKCSVKNIPVLAWCGCEEDFVRVSNPERDQ